ncbi:MAG: gamma carbonic anhydrase family protein [Bacillota bacterium]
MTIFSFQHYYPTLAADVYIAPGARVIGRIKAGAGSSIWFNTVVRGDLDDIAIGRQTNIQDNVSIHVDKGAPVRIGDRVSVGHNAVLHGCTVEDEALIGMGAILLSGAVVGSGSIVAAGALVLPGTYIPPRSLVMGVPGRVIRELAADELPAVEGTYLTYCRLAADYRSGDLLNRFEAGCPEST